MYDELVKELREAEKRAKDFGKNPYRYVPYYGKAADAIEELSKQLLEMGQVGKFLLDVHKINSKMVAPESVDWLRQEAADDKLSELRSAD